MVIKMDGIQAAQATHAAPNYGAAGVQSQKSGVEDLGINDFFKLMAAQLQNQSMFDTVDNTQFLAQMAQFSTLSQISELTNTIKSNMAVSLLGKTVTVGAGGGAITGNVGQVSYNSGTPMLLVDGEYYGLGDIIEVIETSTEIK